MKGLSLSSIIQVVTLERQSCDIVARSDGLSGRLFFREGKLIDAEADDLGGEDAAYAILGWSDPEFEVHATGASHDQVIASDVTHLLLETARRKDESLRDGSGLAVKDTTGSQSADGDETTATVPPAPPSLDLIGDVPPVARRSAMSSSSSTGHSAADSADTGSGDEAALLWQPESPPEAAEAMESVSEAVAGAVEQAAEPTPAESARVEAPPVEATLGEPATRQAPFSGEPAQPSAAADLPAATDPATGATDPAVRAPAPATQAGLVSPAALRRVMAIMEEGIGDALISADLFSSSDGTSYVGVNSMPAACAVINLVSERMSWAFRKGGLPPLARYYCAELEGSRMLFVAPCRGVQLSFIVDTTRIQLGLLLNVILPEVLDALQEVCGP